MRTQSREPHAKKKTAEKKYQKRTTAPETSLDWQLALADVLTDIGRENFVNLVKKNLTQKELEEYQERLAYVTFVKQKRLEEQILREVEYAEERARERLLKSYADSQLKNVSMDDAPTSTKGLLQEILELLLKAKKLTVIFTGLTEKQKKLNEKWDKLHEAKAQKIIDKILDKDNVDILGEELVELVRKKQDQLLEILMPTHPDLMLKINPHLANRIYELGLKDPRLLNPVCLNISKVNDFIGELGFHANLVSRSEPLTGSDLLDAMLGPKGPDGKRIKSQGRQEKFNQVGIPFQSGNHIAKAAMFSKAAGMYAAMKDINNNLESIERRVKQDIQELKQGVRATPKLMPGSKRKRDEQEDERSGYHYKRR